MIVSYLPDPESHPLWPDIQRLLKPAADYGEIPVFGEGECLWVAFEGPTIFAAGTTLLWEDGEAEIRLAGGYRMHDWYEQAEATVTAWARKCGAEKITMRGRKGWARLLRAFGWVVSGEDHDGRTLYQKDL